jgi:hypothetical protein
MNKIFGPNWKTTCSGICSFLMINGLFLTGYLATMVHPPAWVTTASGIATFVTSLMKVWIGFLMVDAGQVLAKVPGTAETVTVPSTEIPLDPKAKVVKP